MSKATQTRQENELLGQITVKAPKTEKPKETKVHRSSVHESELYLPKERECKTPKLLTVEQYLNKAKLDKPVGGLIRSLHKTKVMNFAEWERTTATILTKKTW